MLQPGDIIPEVHFTDENGQRIELAGLLDRPLVLFFYPKDNTPGCTMEACSFRDRYAAFLGVGAAVVGVSSDDKGSHARFRERHQLPFRLITDPDGNARRVFDIPKTWGILPGRATFVIDPDRRILTSFNSQFAPETHVAKALAALTKASQTT
jgi:peroxiredoxin Q/BCP